MTTPKTPNQVSGESNGDDDIKKYRHDIYGISSLHRKTVNNMSEDYATMRTPEYSDRSAAADIAGEEAMDIVNGNVTEGIRKAKEAGMLYEESQQILAAQNKKYFLREKRIMSASVASRSSVTNINSISTTIGGTTSAIRGARASNSTFRDSGSIERQINGMMTGLSEEGGALSDDYAMARNKEEFEALQPRADAYTNKLHEIGELKAGLKDQHRLGRSDEQQYSHYRKSEDRLERIFQDEDIKKAAKDGMLGTTAEHRTALSGLRQDRNANIARQETIRLGADSSGNISAELEKELETLKQSFEKLNKAVEGTEKKLSATEKDDAGGGKMGAFFKRMQGGAQLAQMGLQAVAQTAHAVQEIGVNQQITRMNNRATFAKMGNDIYDKADLAVRGENVDAMLDIASSDRFAQKFGAQSKNRTEANRTTEVIAGGGADLVGNVLKYGTAGAIAGTAVPIIGTGIGAGIGIGAGVVATLSNSVPQYTNIDNDAAAASIASYHAAKNLSAEERHVASKQMQQLFSHGMNTMRAVQGVGGAGALQNNLMQGYVANGLADAGVSLTTAVGLTPLLGAAGNMEYADATNKHGTSGAAISMLEAAGRASQRGQMGKEEYVGAAARLVGAGGKSDDLEEIIAAGMTKGMANSKNINQMVDATLALSNSLAAKGISGTGMVSNMLGGMTQQLADQGVNKNLTTDVAANSMIQLDQSYTDASMTLGNVVKRSELRGVTGLKGANHPQMNAISTMSVKEIGTMRAGGPEAELLKKRLNIDDLNVDDKTWEQVGKIAYKATMINQGAVGTPEYDEIMSKWNTGEALSPKAAAWTNTVGNREAMDMARSANPVKKASDSQYAKTNKLLGSDYDTGQARYEASQVEAGKKATQDALGATEGKEFERIEGLAKSISEAVDPAKWGAEVRAAAEKFAIPAASFLQATGQLEGTVRELVNYQDKMLKNMGQDKIPEEAKDQYPGMSWGN